MTPFDNLRWRDRPRATVYPTPTPGQWPPPPPTVTVDIWLPRKRRWRAGAPTHRPDLAMRAAEMAAQDLYGL